MDLTTMLRKLRRGIASFAVVAIIASLSVASSVSAFSDVKESDWYFDNVEALVDAGVIDGTKDKFNGGANLNRAEAAKIAVTAAGVAEEDLVSPETPSFSDVPKSLWAYKYIETAKSLGYVSGDAGKKTFRPGDNVNRAEFSKIIGLALELEENTDGGPHFSDVKSSDWFYAVVETAYNWSVVNGYEGGTFKPAAAINRAEMSKMTVAAMDPTAREDEPADDDEEPAPTPAPGVDCKVTPDAAGCKVTPPPAAGKVTVSLATDNPAGTSVIAGQAIADLAHFTFANADAAESKITSLKLRRLGVSADTTLVKVYLYDGSKRLSDEATVSSGVISFNNAGGLFTIAAKGSRTIMVKANIKDTSGTSPVGQLVGVGINAVEDVVSTGTVSGNFPLNGNTFTVASASLATLSFTNSAGTTPSANTALDPQTEYTVWQNSVSVGNRAVNLKSITFRNIGSVAVGDLKNFMFFIDGTQVGTTVEKTDADGYVTFDISATPKKLETGTRLFKLQADVVGGSSKNFTISLRQAADVNALDSEFNATILAQTASATFTAVEAGQQTVSSGSLTITKRTDSPSGTVVDNGTNVTLGKFDLKAFGESMKIENLRVNVNTTAPVDGNTAATEIGKLRNGSLYVDGVQVGSTADINGDNSTASYTEFTLGSAVVVDPNKPKVLEIKADMYDNDGTDNVDANTTIKVGIEAGSSNLQRMTSGGYIANTAVTDANTLTVSTGSMAASADQSYGNQSVVVPTTATLLGKFSLAGGSTEDININTLKVDFTFSSSDFASADLSNVYLKYGTKTSAIKSTITTALAGATSSNTWSVSHTLAKNTSLVFDVYGDIASTATSDATADTVTTKFQATGTTVSSGATKYSGAAGADATVTGQVITATSSGNLSIYLDNGTPVAAIAVSGSAPTEGSLKVKLTATNEDIYIKDLTFRVDTNADDAVVSSVSLWKAEGSGSFVQVLGDKAMNSDDTNPGYVQWTLVGTDRVKVPKNGTSYLLVKPTYVSSSEVTVDNSHTPRLLLADLQAEGTSLMSASGTATGTLINSTGIIVYANSTVSGTGNAYVDSTFNNTAADTTATATTLVTSGGTFLTGDVIFVDNDNGGDWDPATEELMSVVLDGGTDLTVKRGVFGTTATAITGDAVNVYRLNTATMTTPASIMGNATRVMRTKLTLAAASDTPSGSTTGGSQRVIFKLSAAAANNAIDAAENKAVLNYVDLTTTKSGLSVQNVKLYPSEFDQNATYATTCVGLSTSKWRCTLNTTGGTNEIVENTSRTYVVRGDVGSITTAGTSNTLDVNIASLGSSAANGDITNGDVSWTDATGGSARLWVHQAGATYVQPASPMTLGASSGTNDATRPLISSLTIANKTGGTAQRPDGGCTDASGIIGAAANQNDIANCDTITVVFNEMMDPTSINASLVPGASTAVVGVLATAAAGLSINSDTANDEVTVTSIGAFNYNATNDTEANDITSTTNLTLNSAGTTLTIYLNTVTNAGPVTLDNAVAADIAAVQTVLKDVNTNLLNDAAVNFAGAF